MSTIWYVVHKRPKSSLSSKWKSSQSIHVKCTAHMGKFMVQISVFLIWSTTSSNEQMFWLETAVFNTSPNQLEDLGLGKRSQATVNVTHSGFAMLYSERATCRLCVASHQAQRRSDDPPKRSCRCHLRTKKKHCSNFGQSHLGVDCRRAKLPLWPTPDLRVSD